MKTQRPLDSATPAEQVLVELLVSLANNQHVKASTIVYTKAFSKAVALISPYIADEHNAVTIAGFRRPELELTNAEKLAQAYLTEMHDLRKELDLIKRQLANARERLTAIRSLT